MLLRRIASIRLWAAPASLVLLCLGRAEAAIVHRVVNLPIPVTQAGLWLNVETGAYTTTATGPAGWDFNIYTSGAYTSGPATGMANIVFYTGSTTGSGFMRLPGTVGGTPPSHEVATTIAPYGSYGSGWATFGAQFGAWKLSSDNYVGFKFIAADGLVHFGWARVAVGAVSQDRTLVEYAFESVPNTCISVGATAGAPPVDCGAPSPYDPCGTLHRELVVGENLPVANQTTTQPFAVNSAGCNFTIEHANFYRFVPPSSGEFSVNTCATSVNTRLAVLTGCSAGSTVLACNDDFCAQSSAITFVATAGVPVWIVVGGASASTGLPSFMPIAIEAPFDPCTNIPAIPLGQTTVAANDAVPPLDMTGHCDPGPVHPPVIYKANYARWTAPKTGYYSFGACPAPFSAHVAVMTSCGDASTVLACSYDKCLATGGARVEFWGTGGVEYILAYGVEAPIEPLPATVTLAVAVEVPPPEPCGADLLEGALGLQSIRLDFEYPNLPLAGSPCSFTYGDQALRYPKYLRFVPPVTGTYTMGNCSDTDPNYWGIYDLRIAVMSECGNAATIFACDDNGCHGDVPPWTSRISSLPLQGGVPVYIGLGGNGPAAPGPFAFEIALESGNACTGDLNADGAVDAQDLAVVLGAWGAIDGDVTGDATTDAQDLAVILGAWGPCP